MPEMPEVEIIRRNLSEKLIDRQIGDIEVFLPRLIKWPSADLFQAMIIGRCICAVERRGKYLLLRLDQGKQVVIHLRMTGRICYVERGQERDAYARIVFHLDNGDSLVYADTRTLGTLYALQPDEQWRISGLTSLGPEPLSAEFTNEYFSGILQKNRGKIKSLLLNQKYIGGLGNIYVDECLHLAGIHPMASGVSLTQEQAEMLYHAVNRVIEEGIRDGGTTFRDYRDGNGKKGSHQENLFVYGRDGKPCRTCETAIEKITVGGRGTHFCPKCQKQES